MPTPKIILVAITKHGARQVAQLATNLPDADLLVSEKFRDLLGGCPRTHQNYFHFWAPQFF